MTKGGPELFDDPVARELLASRIPARVAYVASLPADVPMARIAARPAEGGR